MKKVLFSLMCLFFFSTSSFCQVETSNNTASSNSFQLLPRFFNNKLIVSTKGELKEQKCILRVFTMNGETVLDQNIDLSTGEYIQKTDLFQNGLFIYYIVVDQQIVVKGTFTKS